MAILVQSNKKPSVSFPSQTGSIVTFNSQYAGLPLKSHKIALTATQSGSGTPSPQNIRSINGYSEINIGHYGLNVWGNGITLSDASISGTYKGYEIKYNSNIRMVLFDRDTTQDISGLFLGFTGSGKDATEGIQWVISNGNVFSEGNIFSETYKYISIYPGTQATLDKIFNRFYVLTVIDNGDYSAYVPYVGSTATIQIGSTVYGGEYDARTGLLTVTHGILDLGSITWRYNTTSRVFLSSTGTPSASVMKRYSNAVVANALCDIFKPTSFNDMINNDVDYSLSIANALTNGIHIKDSDYTDATAFETAMNGHMLVYELATPITIQLPPCPIDVLEGVNNIWADTGETTVEHIKIGG